MSDTEQASSPKVESQPEFVEDRTADVIDVPKSEDGAGAPAAEEVSKRLFVRPINHETTMEEVEKLFTAVGAVTDISLKPGYGFIEYEALADADKAIETFNGNTGLGYQIMVERAMARGARRDQTHPGRPVALHRLLISGNSDDFSWQDLKDLSREHGVEAVFTKVDQGNVGVIDVASDEDRDSLKSMKEWKGFNVEVSEDPRGPAPPPRSGGRGGRGRGGRFGGRGGPRFGGYRGDRGDRGDRRGGDRFGGDRFGDRRGGDRFGDRRSFGDRRGDRTDRRSRPQDEPNW